MEPLMAIAVLVAYFVKGICGFANTLVFTTIMGFAADNVNLSPVDLLLGYPANLLIAWKERKHTRFAVWGPLSLMVLLGAIPGALLLKNGDARVIKLLFGLLTAGIGLEMLLRKARPDHPRAPRGAMLVIGLLSGVLCGLYGVGALLAAYVGRTSDHTAQFRGDLCMVFTIENTFRIFLYAGMGILTVGRLTTAAMLIPFMLLGLSLGMWAVRHISEATVRRLVILALLFSGLALAVKQLTALL